MRKTTTVIPLSIIIILSILTGMGILNANFTIPVGIGQVFVIIIQFFINQGMTEKNYSNGSKDKEMLLRIAEDSKRTREVIEEIVKPSFDENYGIISSAAKKIDVIYKDVLYHQRLEGAVDNDNLSEDDLREIIKQQDIAIGNLKVELMNAEEKIRDLELENREDSGLKNALTN